MMGDVARYQDLVEDILRKYASYKSSYGNVDVEMICNPAIGRYQSMTVGWHGRHRVRGCILHAGIKGGKIWIRHDGAEEGIANRLVAAGVPGDDIVLAFHSPFMRRFAEFAVS